MINVIQIILIGISLAMDAFAVSITLGLSGNKITYKEHIKTGFFFGGFQALMPLIGYFVGIQFAHIISEFDHWIAFAILAVIGLNMIREAVKGDGDEESAGKDAFGLKNMFILAVATSIDALTVGITFSFENDTNIWFNIAVIGVITFALCCVGLVLGRKVGEKFTSSAKFVGGTILVLIGAKILLEHLEIISF